MILTLCDYIYSGVQTVVIIDRVKVGRLVAGFYLDRLCVVVLARRQLVVRASTVFNVKVEFEKLYTSSCE